MVSFGLCLFDMDNLLRAVSSLFMLQSNEHAMVNERFKAQSNTYSSTGGKWKAIWREYIAKTIRLILDLRPGGLLKTGPKLAKLT